MNRSEGAIIAGPHQKKAHICYCLYVFLLVFEMTLLTLCMGVGFKQPQILTLYMFGWKGLVPGSPKMYHL